MITKEDFMTWLDDPCTKFFRSWLEKDKNEIKEAETDKIYRNLHKGEVIERSTRILGICHGLERVESMLNECAAQKIDENEQLDVEEKDRKPVYDSIADHIAFVYGGANG